MIEFNADNKLNWKKLDPEQALTFIHFLNCEKARHMVEKDISDRKSFDALPGNKLLSELWRSAYNRHVQDIADIKKTIREVKEYFEVEE